MKEIIDYLREQRNSWFRQTDTTTQFKALVDYISNPKKY